MTLSLRHTGGRWGSHRASYTLSKALDNAGNAFFSSPQDNFDVDDDYGRSDNDQRHRLVLSGAAPVEWGLDLSYIFAAASAPPFNIQTGGDRNGDTTVNDRPAGVGRNTGTGSRRRRWMSVSGGDSPSAAGTRSKPRSTRSTSSTRPTT